MFFVVGNRHDAQAGTLPQIVELDLGHSDIEFLDSVLDAPQHHPLVFERSRTGDVEFDRQVADDHRCVKREAWALGSGGGLPVRPVARKPKATVQSLEPKAVIIYLTYHE